MAAEWPYHITDQAKALHLAIEPDCPWKNEANCSLRRTIQLVLDEQERWLSAQRKNVDFLVENLGRKMVLHVSDGRSIGETAETFRAAREVLTLIAEAEGDEMARAWIIGMNPHLGDESPILALKEGRALEVFRAARAYLNGQWT